MIKERGWGEAGTNRNCTPGPGASFLTPSNTRVQQNTGFQGTFCWAGQRRLPPRCQRTLHPGT